LPDPDVRLKTSGSFWHFWVPQGYESRHEVQQRNETRGRPRCTQNNVALTISSSVSYSSVCRSQTRWERVTWADCSSECMPLGATDKYDKDHSAELTRMALGQVGQFNKWNNG
jgi:hypothetical protein